MKIDGSSSHVSYNLFLYAFTFALTLLEESLSAFVKTIENLDVEVTVERLGQTVSGCSIMGLMMLAASQGTTIKINAQGKQSEEAISLLKNLINSKFGED